MAAIAYRAAFRVRGVHAGLGRLRIRLSASSAVSSAVGRLCRYFSVVEMFV
jgi:hypothetical protein